MSFFSGGVGSFFNSWVKIRVFKWAKMFGFGLWKAYLFIIHAKLDQKLNTLHKPSLVARKLYKLADAMVHWFHLISQASSAQSKIKHSLKLEKLAWTWWSSAHLAWIPPLAEIKWTPVANPSIQVSSCMTINSFMVLGPAGGLLRQAATFWSFTTVLVHFVHSGLLYRCYFPDFNLPRIWIAGSVAFSSGGSKDLPWAERVLNAEVVKITRRYHPEASGAVRYRITNRIG